MSEFKALLFCNNPIALPGLREFLFRDKVAGIVIPERNKEMRHILGQLTGGNNIPLLFVKKNNYKEVITGAVEQYQPAVALVMTFPYILDTGIINAFPKGVINFHYGLLPQCRGPQPVLWHLLNNDEETGVTVHKIIDEGVDTGPIVLQERIPIEEHDTYGKLQTKLAYLGAKLAENLLKILSYGTVVPAVEQDETKAAYYNMPGAAQLTINWKEMSAAQIIRLANACNPWNKGAGAIINNWLVGITEAELIGDCETSEEPGTILTCNSRSGLSVKTADSKKIKLNIVYTNEGFFSGNRLEAFGIQAGMKFS